MAKTKRPDDGTFPPPRPAAASVDLPVFPGFDLTPEPEGMQQVTLTGGGPLDGVYRVPIAIPQVLTRGAAKYDLSDRMTGLYVWKFR